MFLLHLRMLGKLLHSDESDCRAGLSRLPGLNITATQPALVPVLRSECFLLLRPLKISFPKVLIVNACSWHMATIMTDDDQCPTYLGLEHLWEALKNKVPLPPSV